MRYSTCICYYEKAFDHIWLLWYLWGLYMNICDPLTYVIRDCVISLALCYCHYPFPIYWALSILHGMPSHLIWGRIMGCILWVHNSNTVLVFFSAYCAPYHRFIPLLVPLLASDLLTTVIDKHVSRIWRHQRDKFYACRHWWCHKGDRDGGTLVCGALIWSNGVIIFRCQWDRLSIYLRMNNDRPYVKLLCLHSDVVLTLNLNIAFILSHISVCSHHNRLPYHDEFLKDDVISDITLANSDRVCHGFCFNLLKIGFKSIFYHDLNTWNQLKRLCIGKKC